MNERQKRLDQIKMILSSRKASGQSEILSLLAEMGTHITQATLSRDLKQLGASRIIEAGEYKYVLPATPRWKRVGNDEDLSEMMKMPGFVSITFSGNMGVIKTRPGYASSIAYNIDNSNLNGILGTIAGDDTIFIVVAEGVSEALIVKQLMAVVPNMEN